MISYRSFAKINLHLEVVRRRDDGFHDLRTVFSTIDLADDLRIGRRASAGIELRVSGADLPTDRRNLARQAAEAFERRFPGGGGVAIEIDKRIPVSGGLGGGSSNAATTLLGLARDRGWDPFAPEVGGELHRLAAAIGSDVPFFLVGGLAIGSGRGERLQPLPDVAPTAAEPELWLAIPPFGSPTAEVYARCRPRGEQPPSPALARALAGEAVRWIDLIGENDLEEPAFSLRRELGAVYTAMVRAGARVARMSGSGSTLFALFEAPAAARAVAAELPSRTHWLQSSMLGRAAWRRSGGFDPFEGGS
ncbi:MAG TPA: 4-(cytidine 5'-diphospho)-2-C-methyl-D-erythritol kinase [Thermoanaerobaculia bacterium]|nr:4-(cytidine 5'-diphospho)-2-C-methyl-D-erythritol kinase [Thermoanaerobaculia bacterium]